MDQQLTHLPVQNRFMPLIPVVPETPRESKLADALSKARDNCGPVPIKGWNNYHKYHYATAQDIILTGKDALKGSGLAFIMSAPQLDVIGTGNATIYALKRRVALAHSSGESVDMGELNWPVLPDKGRPLDKALSAACTTSLSILYRDLLQMGCVDQGDDVSGREDASESSQTASAVQPPSQTVQTASAPANDAQEPVKPAPVITTEQEATLDGLIQSTGTDRGKFMTAFRIKELRQLPADQFDIVHKRLVDRQVQLNQAKKSEPVTSTQAAPTPVTPTAPVTQTPSTVPTLEKDKMPELIRRLQDAGIKAEAFAEFLGVERFSQCPVSWWTWMRLFLAGKPDLHEVKKTYNIKTIRELPEERIEAMTRNLLYTAIDNLTSELGINQEEWKTRLQQLYKTTDSTALDREQLESLEARLSDYKSKKLAKK